MKGFKRASFALKKGYDSFTHQDILIPTNPIQENLIMQNAGFIIDKQNDVYVKKGLGAYKTNIDEEISSIEDLRNYYDELFSKNPYDDIIKLIDEEGYDFIIGPGAPANDGVVYGNGLYCKNYKEIIENQKANKLQEDKKER